MSIWMNSKMVKKGDVFLVTNDNKKYVSEAIKNGAKLIVTETDDVFEIKTKKVKNVKDYLKGKLYPLIKDITLIGITGTNGKTTTCYLIYQMLNMLGIKTAFIGTIGFYVGEKIFDLNNTTPTMDVLYELILKAKEKDCKVVVTEVSSHALKQERLHGLLFDAVGVTNVTQDHLDYHKTMEDYVNSKALITNLTRNKKIVILNGNDKYYKMFLKRDNNNYVIEKDVIIKNVLQEFDKVKINTSDGTFNIKLLGRFNVFNFLMAYEIIKKLGYSVSKLDFLKLTEPPGRMQMINYKDNYILIDYAHTPDAVENVLKTVCETKNKGIITIIGCGGNRDKSKRPLMAKIACENSSYVIFTNDNPRCEDEKLIMNDILKGAFGSYEVIYNRGDAIKRGIDLLDGNKILMILGKGHECYQIIGKTKHHFSDYEEVNKTILKL